MKSIVIEREIGLPNPLPIAVPSAILDAIRSSRGRDSHGKVQVRAGHPIFTIMSRTSAMHKGFLIGLVVLLLAVFWSVIVELVTTWWTDDNYSHGFLVPLVSAYLIWRNRLEISTVAKSRSNLGLIILIAGMLMFVVGNAGSEHFTRGVSLVVTLFGLTFYLYGREVISRTWFAFFLLLFMIPIPAVIYFSATFPMQLLASKITVALMEFLGIAVVRHGNIIHLPGHALEVADACSGLRSLVSLMAMGAIYGYLSQERLWARGVVFLMTVPIAVCGNVVRVLLAALLTYTFEIDTTTEPLHSIIGLVMFVFSFAVLFAISGVLRRLAR